MGFLDRVKAGFNQTVGGKTAVQLELAEKTVAPGQAISYRLVLVTSGPLQAQRVVVGLYGRERVRVWTGAPSPALAVAASDAWSAPAPLAATAARETTTFQLVEPVVPGELTLPAGQTREYQGELPVPADAQPTYRGVNAQHTWWVRATVEIPLGVDQVEETEVIIR